MSAVEVEEISTVMPRPLGVIQQPQRVTKRSRRSARAFVVALITMIILAAGIALHSYSLFTTHLATLKTTTGFDRFYKFPFEDPPKSDISMGLWKMCSDAWHFDCVDWGSSTKVDNVTQTIVSIKKPDWLVVAQYTGVIGLVMAAITEVIVITCMCIGLVDPSKLCRLYTVVTCMGALIGGGLVFVSCVYVVMNYDSLPHRIAMLEEEANNTDLMFKTSFSISWGYHMDIASVLVMWMAGLVSLCNHRGAGKAWKKPIL